MDVFSASEEIPLFATELVLHEKKPSIRIFLCGKEVSGETPDLRHSLKKFLKKRIRCEPFLGEEIPDLLRFNLDRDHLTVELKEAAKSHLIIMFLGSPGTFSEITAFVMTKGINKKLLVFNDEKFKDLKSFLNLGPLKLLLNDQKIYYNGKNIVESYNRVLKAVDWKIADFAFNRNKQNGVIPQAVDFYSFILIGTLFVSQPIKYHDLSNLYPSTEHRLRICLKELSRKGVCVNYRSLWSLKDVATLLPNEATWFNRWSELRLRLLNSRLKSDDVIDNPQRVF